MRKLIATIALLALIDTSAAIAQTVGLRNPSAPPPSTNPDKQLPKAFAAVAKYGEISNAYSARTLGSRWCGFRPRAPLCRPIGAGARASPARGGGRRFSKRTRHWRRVAV